MFYEYLEKTKKDFMIDFIVDHIRLLLTLVLFLLLVLFMFFMIPAPVIQHGLNFKTDDPISFRKTELLYRVSSSTPLSLYEQSIIMNETSEKKVDQYNLTNEEIEKILRALNNNI